MRAAYCVLLTSHHFNKNHIFRKQKQKKRVSKMKMGRLFFDINANPNHLLNGTSRMIRNCMQTLQNVI